MKKIFIIITFILCAFRLYPQVTCTNGFYKDGDNTINLHFEMPDYDIFDTIVPDNLGIMRRFAYIHLNDNSFGAIDSVGFPYLPYLPINVSVPKNTSNYRITIDIFEVTSMSISDYLLPAQPYIPKDYINTYSFVMDTNFYTSNDVYYQFNVQIDDEYIIFGEKGLSLSLIPFEYNPDNGSLKIIESANIQVMYDIDDNYVYDRRYTNSTENYLNGCFCNYMANRTDMSADNYLIITDPEFVETIKYFANYKRNIGFNVIIQSTDVIGNNSSSIKSYIQNMYDNVNTRPEYILLVGDVEKIPVSGGSSSDIDNPYTDINYSLLEGNDLKADVFIGRFPVSTQNELHNIINKTIYMEMNLPYRLRKVSLIAGYENRWIMENYFELGHNSAAQNAFKINDYECAKLYQPTEHQISNSLFENPIFLIYSGHGSDYSWGISQNITINKFDIIDYTNEIIPFTFAFACNTGDYNVNDCIGEEWLLCNDKGAIAYFGSSVTTLCHSDYLIEKKIFDKVSFESLSISSLINMGKNKYKDHFFGIVNKRMKRYLKSYNLFGDPSIIINGVDYIHNLIFDQDEILNSNEYSEYYSSSTIANRAGLVLNNNSKLYLHAGEEIILSDGFHAKEGSCFLAEITSTNSSRGNNDDALYDGALRDISHEYREATDLTHSNESLHGITIYPNPTDGMFNVSFNNPDECLKHITIVNHLGSVVVNRENPDDNTIDMNNLSSGLYIVKIISDKGNVYFDKVIKK